MAWEHLSNFNPKHCVHGVKSAFTEFVLLPNNKENMMQKGVK